ncbi:hypothetical protein LOTGIDRAFT_223139 [Lottia gigantea]|uniref:AAA+ ATPase domain-containing protein n=1 Tax=Lottia gigantea TaxID=225164 RepID=V3ZFT9_LOTGI|nr:hypothetical protein LOTGIDRAFT_223139 [Lottia gigantea]ESO82982.1 hypothetical protein LOTGIDRAFT_223139 [Lottia gigantea]
MTARHIILTGPPGVGKSTLIQKACDAIKSKGISVQGFYTEEIRSGGRRTGFDVVTLDGKRGPLARVSEGGDGLPSSKKRDYKVGQYSVQLQSFEQIALPTLHLKDEKCVIVIDEIGKMELFSQTFIQCVRSILDNDTTTVLATIPICKGKPIPFVEEIRHRQDSQVFTISQSNRNSILGDILQAVQASVK